MKKLLFKRIGVLLVELVLSEMITSAIIKKIDKLFGLEPITFLSKRKGAK